MAKSLVPEKLLQDADFVRDVLQRRVGLKKLNERYKLALSRQQYRELRAKLSPPKPASNEVLDTVVKGDTMTTTLKNTKLTTAEDLARAHGIDMRIWEPVEIKTGRWEMGYKTEDGDASTEQLGTIRVVWKRIISNERIINVTDSLIKELKKHSPSIPKPKYRKVKPKDRHLIELCVFDAHIGKHAWAEESGHDYDLEIACTSWETAVWDLMNKSSHHELERIVLVLGQDFFNVDSMVNETTAGTRQDEDSRWQKSFIRAREMTARTIQQLGEIAPCHVIVVPGNHDTQRSFYLGQVLDAHFSRAKHISIDCSAQTRKAFRYGKNMVMLTHGDKEKNADLGSIMAMEFPDLWAQTLCREVHHGHLHKRRTTVTTSDHHSVVVRQVPCLCPAEYWHASRGYRGMPNSKAFIWHKTDLLQAIVQHYPKPFRDLRMPVMEQAVQF